MLKATFKLENVHEYKQPETGKVYYSLVGVTLVHNSKLGRDMEEFFQVSIPEKFIYTRVAFEKAKGKIITVQVKEKVFDEKFSGYSLVSDNVEFSESLPRA